VHRDSDLGRPFERHVRQRCRQAILGLNHIDPAKWIIAGEMETGGGALMWFRDTFCQDEARQAAQASVSTYEWLSQMAGSVEPGSDKLALCSLASRRARPGADHYARGGFIGLSLGHTKSHLARAVMEGVAYHIAGFASRWQQLGCASARSTRLEAAAPAPSGRRSSAT